MEKQTPFQAALVHTKRIDPLLPWQNACALILAHIQPWISSSNWTAPRVFALQKRGANGQQTFIQCSNALQRQSALHHWHFFVEYHGL